FENLGSEDHVITLVQLIHLKYLLFTGAVNFLMRYCKATIIGQGTSFHGHLTLAGEFRNQYFFLGRPV
ncbi:MAG: hypothetical protein WA635_09665, partial [Gallionella sp.]